jgi:hypothetical protein
MPTTPEPAPVEETPDLHGAYPRLSSGQLQPLAALGERHEVRAGDVLHREGEASCDFFVILEGKVAVAESSGEMLAVHGPGRFVGELGLLTGRPVFLTASVRESGAVGCIPTERLREFIASGMTRRGRRRDRRGGPALGVELTVGRWLPATPGDEVPADDTETVGAGSPAERRSTRLVASVARPTACPTRNLGVPMTSTASEVSHEQQSDRRRHAPAAAGRRRFDAVSTMQPEYFDIAVDDMYADDAARMLLGLPLPSRVKVEPPSTIESTVRPPRPTPVM